MSDVRREARMILFQVTLFEESLVFGDRALLLKQVLRELVAVRHSLDGLLVDLVRSIKVTNFALVEE